MEFHLMRGEEVLGVLVLKTTDFPWINCEFKPAASFEEVRSYFDEELKLVEADSMEEWESAYARINALGLRLIDVEKGEDIGDFLLHVQGDEAWFRY